MENMKIAENIANIGIWAGILHSEGKIKIEVGDSENLVETIIELAERFEDELGEIAEKEEDYIGYIDLFAQKELLKQYTAEEVVLLGISDSMKDSSIRSKADFFIADESKIEKMIEDNVVIISEELKESCALILNKMGYEMVDDCISYHDHVLSFEIKQI